MKLSLLLISLVFSSPAYCSRRLQPVHRASPPPPAVIAARLEHEFGGSKLDVQTSPPLVGLWPWTPVQVSQAGREISDSRLREILASADGHDLVHQVRVGTVVKAGGQVLDVLAGLGVVSQLATAVAAPDSLDQRAARGVFFGSVACLLAGTGLTYASWHVFTQPALAQYNNRVRQRMGLALAPLNAGEALAARFTF